jgi:hypothetical protein
VFFVALSLQQINAQNWRSSLYPEDWTPGYTDSNGRFLHDFSYAGYKYGFESLPNRNVNIKDVTLSPYNADNTGSSDVTAVIQKALDDAGKAGGGIVYLPQGIYKISVSSSSTSGLRIMYNNVILRGAGVDKTFIVNATTAFRSKQALYITGSGASSWDVPVGSSFPVQNNIQKNSLSIQINDVSSFSKGDLIVLATDCTSEMIAEYNATSFWTTGIKGQRYCRIIENVNPVTKTITVDIPIRQIVKLRDNARVYKVKAHVTESGFEDFSIGNMQNPKIMGVSNNDLAFMEVGTGEYEVHGTYLITLRNTMNCWVKNVKSYRPAENSYDVHMLSNALRLIESKNVTVTNCTFSNPQYRGGGGNGYMFAIESNDCLITNCRGERARHHFSFKSMLTTGNVVHQCSGLDSRLSVDYHMHMSAVNLIDSYTSEGDYIEAIFRNGGDISGILHGYTTTESVIWNTKGTKAHWKNFLIDSRQYGNGYVIGTSGIISNVITTPVSESPEGQYAYDTSPEDWVEGVGAGDLLEPQSLYLDQLAKRQLCNAVISSIDNKKTVTMSYISPNILEISFSADNDYNRCLIYDIYGRVILSTTISPAQSKLAISTTILKNGVYVISFVKNNVAQENYKLIAKV